MRQIIAMGGGGFSMEPDNPLLDTYILQQANNPEPKICFIGTASGDSDGYVERFYKFFKQQKCQPSHLSLFRLNTNNIEEFILAQDIIYVGGGNTRNLMVLWKEWGLDNILRTAYEKGIILCGISAGSICWFEEGLTDSIPDNLMKLNCLGFLKGSNCPHFDGEEKRRPKYKELIEKKIMQGGIGADDGVALHYQNEKLFKVIASQENINAYKFSLENGQLKEEILKPQYLGNL